MGLHAGTDRLRRMEEVEVLLRYRRIAAQPAPNPGWWHLVGCLEEEVAVSFVMRNTRAASTIMGSSSFLGLG